MYVYLRLQLAVDFSFLISSLVNNRQSNDAKVKNSTDLYLRTTSWEEKASPCAAVMPHFVRCTSSVSHRLHSLLWGWRLRKISENMTQPACAKTAQPQFPCSHSPQWWCAGGWLLPGSELDGGSGWCIIWAQQSQRGHMPGLRVAEPQSSGPVVNCEGQTADHMEMNNVCLSKEPLNSRCMSRWHANKYWKPLLQHFHIFRVCVSWQVSKAQNTNKAGWANCTKQVQGRIPDITVVAVTKDNSLLKAANALSCEGDESPHELWGDCIIYRLFLSIQSRTHIYIYYSHYH